MSACTCRVVWTPDPTCEEGLGINLAQKCLAGMTQFLNSANFLFQIFNAIGQVLLWFSTFLCSTVYSLPVISLTQMLVGWSDVFFFVFFFQLKWCFFGGGPDYVQSVEYSCMKCRTSECMCRTWSSCMHMTLIRMWLSIKPQATVYETKSINVWTTQNLGQAS